MKSEEMIIEKTLESKEMVVEKTWKEFRESGLLWWINTILHTFGWAIAVKVNDLEEIVGVYPARVRFRGFGEKQIEEGYVKISKFMVENAEDLLEEAKE